MQKALHKIWFCALDIHINRKQLTFTKEKEKRRELLRNTEQNMNSRLSVDFMIIKL